MAAPDQAVGEADVALGRLHRPAAGLIDAKDIASAQQHLGIAPADCAVMLIATFRRMGNSFETSVNMRAPLFIDTANRLAWQYILPNDRYEVRHTL